MEGSNLRRGCNTICCLIDFFINAMRQRLWSDDRLATTAMAQSVEIGRSSNLEQRLLVLGIARLLVFQNRSQYF